MASPRTRRCFHALAITAVVGITSAIAAATAPVRVAAAGPALTVSPPSGLLDGQFVKVDVSGFAPTTGVVFRECIVNPVNVATDCTSPNTTFSAVTDATGAGETYLAVYSLAASLPGGSGYTTFPITCDATHACVLAAFDGTTTLPAAAYAPLAFAPSTTNCPNPGARAVFGSGEATAYRALYSWQATVCVAPYNLPVVYALSNGPDGVSNFGQGQQQANFGVMGTLPPITLPSTAPTYKVAPITGSALVLAYKMYDRRGPQITNLTLTPWEISEIYSGQLSDLATDPGVTSLNPGVEFPGSLQTFVRAEHSAESYVLTSWLNATLGPGSWPAGTQTIFPPHGGLVPETGSRNEGFNVANPLTPWFSTGNIGFMDSSTAAYYGLPAVNIRMPSGAVVSATPSSIAKGLALATPNSDGTYAPSYTPSDPTAWPMSVISYMLVPTSQITAANGQVLAGFLKYAMQQGQANMPSGYVPLPASMVNESLAAANAIPTSESSSPPAGATPSNAGLIGSPSFGTGAGALGSLGGLPGLGSSSGTGASAAGCTGTACASASPAAVAAPSAAAAALLIADSRARFVLVGIAAVALFGVVTGPLTYLLARDPELFRRRLRWLRALRPGRGASP